MENAKHFVLVHGTCLRAWCWYKLVALLRHAGHRVTALDLGGFGIHSNQIHEVASIWDYVQPLMEFLGSIHEDEKPICLITLPFPESSYRAEPDVVGQAVIAAVKNGYRHIDCASVQRGVTAMMPGSAMVLFPT
ncbi:hypothetical protein ACFXTH_022922 [Malus domestica]